MKRHLLLKFLLSWLICLQIFAANDNAIGVRCDLVIFSYDRPLQVYATLESIEKYVKDIRKITVLTRCTNDLFRRQYIKVGERFPQAKFVFQSPLSPERDFKSLLIKHVYGEYGKGAKYIMFAVDDDIFTGNINITKDLKEMIDVNAYAFYYRLGKSITYSNWSKTPSPNPPFEETKNGYLTWIIQKAKGCWAYPNIMDCTIYRKKDFKTALHSLVYTNPNELERGLRKKFSNIPRPLGICHTYPKMINIVANSVTPVRPRTQKKGSPEHLVDLFRQGYKIDISEYAGRKNSSPHLFENYKYIKR